MYKKDSTVLGILIGLALPALVFGLLTLINLIIKRYFSEDSMILLRTMFLLSMFTNLLTLRLYFVSWKFEKTGRGILLITFILMIVYFVVISPLR